VIKSWKNAKRRKLHDEGKIRGFGGLDLDDALEILKMLNAAPSLDALSPLKSVGLHRFKGDRKGQWAMTLKGPWRVCFTFRDGNAFDVEIVNYHKG